MPNTYYAALESGLRAMWQAASAIYFAEYEREQLAPLLAQAEGTIPQAYLKCYEGRILGHYLWHDLARYQHLVEEKARMTRRFTHGLPIEQPITPPERACALTQEQLAEALTEARRELNVREKAYPRWILDGRLSSTKAEQRLRAQHHIVAFLEEATTRYQAAQTDLFSMEV